MKTNPDRISKLAQLFTCCLFSFVPFIASAQEVLFVEDFENLRQYSGAPLNGFNDWGPAKPGGNTPTINVTVAFDVAAGGAPDNGYAQRDIGNLGLTPTSRLQIDFLVALSQSSASSGAFNAAVGVGPGIPEGVDLAPLHIGANYGGFYLRQDAWGSFATAVAPGGEPLRLIATEIYHVRGMLDFAANTGTMMQRNVSQGEEEFSQLYFDPDQTISELSLGEHSDVTTWDTVWIRLGWSGGSRLLELTLTDPDAGAEDTWAGYPVTDGTLVDTGGFLGWLFIGETGQRTDWVYSFSLGNYLYLPEASAANPGGSWVWVLNP